MLLPGKGHLKFALASSHFHLAQRDCVQRVPLFDPKLTNPLSLYLLGLPNLLLTPNVANFVSSLSGLHHIYFESFKSLESPLWWSSLLWGSSHTLESLLYTYGPKDRQLWHKSHMFLGEGASNCNKQNIIVVQIRRNVLMNISRHKFRHTHFAEKSHILKEEQFFSLL